MGNTRSAPQHEEDIWWNNNSSVDKSDEVEPKEETPSDRQRRHKQELDEFKLELARKHEKRRQIIAEKRKEMEDLRDQVKRLKQENEELKNGRLTSGPNDLEEIKRNNLELKMTVATLQKDIQDLNSEVINFEKERADYKAHVVALKDVVSVSKQMLMIREAQLKEMREKIKEIEASLAGKELKVLSQDLKAEYEKQLQNIRNLRIVYEERQRADKKQKDELKNLVEEVKKELQDEKEKNSELGENLARLEEDNSKKYDEIKNLESNLGLTKAECRQYQAELSVINQLFSQILLGFKNNQEIDIDKLIKLLEENHHLLQDIAVNEESNQVSALPKVLLDLVSEVSEEASKTNPETQISNQVNSASEIVENLPKVWKVLIELLSHQSAPTTNEDPKNENPCYKVVEGPKGPHLVLSVSQTFIRLKDLILEKKSLERETNRLKQLNTHLEGRLQEQEKRLELVSNELSETWHVVGKLQKKHELLHTQEKILRYELAQKRKLLTELKGELEYSREKWQEAREKNSNTEKQWEQLRIEFASRKNGGGDDSNNSIESGYSDDKESSSEDDYDIDENKEKTIDAREERLMRLESQASSLVKQVTNTTSRGEAMVSKLDSLHEMYGEGQEEGETSGRGAE
ncbi:probable DNA double-strand break repair Rad50 ATPase [Tribolium madens]|uniref:probable DNA double-strand break repair Rad50 ATPase n=1 Tax=Tribolium madens TaxID=41895 RepID=UPI001CF75BC1|nr:probable DNA double-strand break repair Rad50 ATPase [Tribolium madens]